MLGQGTLHYSTAQDAYLSYCEKSISFFSRAFLLLLILLGSACVTQRVPSDTESGTVDFAKTEECRNVAPQLNPIRSTSSVPDERCQNELKGS